MPSKAKEELYAQQHVENYSGHLKRAYIQCQCLGGRDFCDVKGKKTQKA